MGPMWFVRMARWARNPPSPGRVKLVVAIIVACFVLYGIELIWGWPDWATPNRLRR